jgi:hypothetical protein
MTLKKHGGIGENMSVSLLRKQVVGIFLIGVLFFPVLGTAGCTSKPKSKQSPVNIFSFPRLKKEEPKTGKVTKDPDVPVTMGEVLMLQRNDVL